MNEEKLSMLETYGENLTKKKYVTNPAIARENEIEKTLLILLMPEKSAILIGKAGIGKTAIIEGISYKIQNKDVPEAIKNFEIIKINTSSLLGTTTNDGNQELKLQLLLNELKDKENIILFIDEIHTLVTASKKEGGVDFINMLKPGLDRGKIKIVGATTTDEYNRYLITDKAFLRRFEKVEVAEPSQETTVRILMGSYPKIEAQTGVKLAYSNFIIENIMKFIVNMTSEYKRVYELGSRYPDNALALLSKAFSYAKFDNSEFVTFKHFYKAVMNCQSVYPDVIKKEKEVFINTFKEYIEKENVDLNEI